MANNNKRIHNQVPRNVRIVRVAGSVLKVPTEAFKDCQELEEVILEEGVECIGQSAFSSCLALSKVKFPSTLRTIQSFAFYNCCCLSSIDLPVGIQAIGIGGFELCTGLKHLDLSHHTQCTMIDKCAFQGCYQLAVVRLPPNLKGLILMEVFCDCTALTHIRFPPGVTDISPSAVEGCTSLMSLEVPEGLWRFDVVPNVTGGSDGIQSCPSLVNLYTPPEQWIVSRVDGMSFPSDFTLGRLAVGWRDLVVKLQCRFKDRPLHKICYFQSYHPVLDSIQEMRGILASNPMAHEQVDTMGMTPLHILMLAETPVMELLQELPTTSLKTMVENKDLFGSTPLDYRCKNAAGREAIRSWLPQILEERLPHLGLDRWKKEVLLEEEQGITTWEDDTVVSRHVGSVLNKLLQCEFREVLSVVELVLWKIKLTQNHKDGAEEENVWRQKCRVQCGIAIVVENTVPFLLEAGTNGWWSAAEARSNLNSLE